MNGNIDRDEFLDNFKQLAKLVDVVPALASSGVALNCLIRPRVSRKSSHGMTFSATMDNL